MDEVKIEIIPERELFYNEGNGYGIFACSTCDKHKDQIELNKYGYITVKGNMQRLTLGDTYKAELKKYHDPKYGTGYEVKVIYQELPQTLDQQKDFFRSILTPLQVEEIYKVYDGQDIVGLIKNGEFDYKKVKGFGEYQYEKMEKKVFDNLGIQDALSFFTPLGLKYNQIVKLVKEFKSPQLLIEEVKENPYLLTKVSGYGFKKVDPIAKKMGYDPEGEFRIESCIKYIISEEEKNGHSYILENDLLKNATEMLMVKKERIKEVLSNDIEDLVQIDNKIAFQKVYDKEKYIAKRLKEIQSQSYQLNFDVEEFIERKNKQYGIKVTDEQKQLFYSIKENNVNFLVGYAGTGKSKMQQIMIDLLEELKLSYLLLSPTAKAAKVLKGYTGKDASTIHRAIGTFGDEDEEGRYDIYSDVVVVDESSMSDINIMFKLLYRIKNKRVKILFVGDNFQLPSVGIGNFLHNSIESNVFPIVKLTQVHRQEDGGILDVATKIRLGEKIVDNSFVGKKKIGKDLLFHSVDPTKMKKGYLHYYQYALKKYDPEDIVIISPTKKSDLGTLAINKEIQSIVNPPSENKKELEYGDIVFRQGDLVMNTHNMYSIEDINLKLVDVVNGDMGYILDIDNDKKIVIIDFYDFIVPISYGNLKHIVHRYAITCHRMQGSSSKVVIALFNKSHKYQLNANLLYTGVTRAEEHCFILTQSETFNFGLMKFANLQRNNFLQELLEEKEAA